MLKLVEVSMPTATNLHLKSFLNPNPSPSLPILTRNPSKRPTKSTSNYAFKTCPVFPSWKLSPPFATASCENLLTKSLVVDEDDKKEKISSKKRVFFLDVNPLCYDGSKPSLQSFVHWISLFFNQVSLSHPVIAVFDGEGGNDRRKQLLPSYKAHRRRWFKLSSMSKFRKDHLERSQVVTDILSKCNVPIVKVEGHEADDVVATLVEQALERGYRVVIASPDKDFKQLISDDVQIVSPIRELDRWSFYTMKHYIAQYSCDPSSDLSLRCIIGDEVDGVPGLQDVAPGFGRKTALKLLKKHGSLEHLLNAAAVRSVGRQYVQEALTKHGDYLRRNYEVLALKRDVDVHLQEEWLVERDARKDSIILSNFSTALKESKNSKHHGTSQSSSSQYSDSTFCKNPQNVEDNGQLERLRASAFGFSFGQITLFSSAQVAHASDSIKTNALYDIGELFELGIQLSYLLLLLALLGVGTFFVIRQVLVRRELDLSAKELQEQVRSGDASATEYFELGAVMLRRKFYPAATKYLLQAIDKWDGDDQDLAQVYNALGVSYVRDGKLDKGIEQFETAVKLQPGYVTAWNNLGDAYEEKKDLKSALKAFEEVLLFDPNNKVARPRRDALKDRVQMYKGIPVKSKDR